jgi:hypothetical protein
MLVVTKLHDYVSEYDDIACGVCFLSGYWRSLIVYGEKYITPDRCPKVEDVGL